MKANADPLASLVILGAGYTGRWLYELRRRSDQFVTVTSRRPAHHLDYADPTHRCLFDLANVATWAAIPAHASLLWCFPATPMDTVRTFARTATLAHRRVVVLGSTSAYDVGADHESPPAWVDESAPLDLTKPRVEGEEFLRNECGAIVLRVAGIYGPGRNPLDWIRQGRVGPSPKYVNLIHVEDLAAICLTTLEHGKPGEIYNVSDGTPRTWESICTAAQERWGVLPQEGGERDHPGKRISVAKLRETLGYRWRYPDLLLALDHLTDSTPSR